jgi:hypothetical protein
MHVAGPIYRFKPYKTPYTKARKIHPIRTRKYMLFVVSEKLFSGHLLVGTRWICRLNNCKSVSKWIIEHRF